MGLDPAYLSFMYPQNKPKVPALPDTPAAPDAMASPLMLRAHQAAQSELNLLKQPKPQKPKPMSLLTGFERGL